MLEQFSSLNLEISPGLSFSSNKSNMRNGMRSKHGTSALEQHSPRFTESCVKTLLVASTAIERILEGQASAFNLYFCLV